MMSSSLISCQPSSNNSQNALLQKINAVQEQLMTQRNITAEDEQAISGLCRTFSQDDGFTLHPKTGSMILKDMDIAPVYMACEE